jgi:hypothetical protein
VEEAAPARPDRLRLAAILGAAASAVVVVAFFLPWIHVPREVIESGRLRRAFDRDLDSFEGVHPTLTHGFRVLLDDVERTGRATGFDLFVFSRSARRVGEAFLAPREDGRAPRAAVDDPDVGRRAGRAYHAVSIVLAALPIAALLLLVHFVAHGFRRARSPTLILLTVVGVVGGLLATSWYVFASSVSFESGETIVKTFTGNGLRATLVAGFTQACCGILGVTGRNWWRVYTGAFAMLAAIALVVWAYVWQGISP